MWIALIATWILGSVALYTILIKTAKEPIQDDCLDCTQSECNSCLHANAANEEIRRAA